jgi:hypothetical protein
MDGSQPFPKYYTRSQEAHTGEDVINWIQKWDKLKLEFAKAIKNFFKATWYGLIKQQLLWITTLITTHSV